jgi:hypothetical protein
VTVVSVSPWVTDERIDDVVMAIHLETGAYYVLDGSAADCWTHLASGADPDALPDLLAARYDVDPATARVDAAAFVAGLVDEGLLVTPGGSGAPTRGDASLVGPDGGARAYSPPVVQRYDDLDDLLAIDPIHEVDEAGWPVARPG